MTEFDDTLKPADPFGILTVGQLRAFIDGLDDETQVVLDDGDGWFVNVAEVKKPVVFEAFDDDDTDEFSEYQALTFFIGTPFDARQL